MLTLLQHITDLHATDGGFRATTWDAEVISRSESDYDSDDSDSEDDAEAEDEEEEED